MVTMAPAPDNKGKVFKVAWIPQGNMIRLRGGAAIVNGKDAAIKPSCLEALEKKSSHSIERTGFQPYDSRLDVGRTRSEASSMKTMRKSRHVVGPIREPGGLHRSRTAGAGYRSSRADDL